MIRNSRSAVYRLSRGIERDPAVYVEPRSIGSAISYNMKDGFLNFIVCINKPRIFGYPSRPRLRYFDKSTAYSGLLAGRRRVTAGERDAAAAGPAYLLASKFCRKKLMSRRRRPTMAWRVTAPSRRVTNICILQIVAVYLTMLAPYS